MKVFFKKLLLIILLVCILVPSLFSGFALAAEDNVDMVLTKERAGNYAANFAINFYENWSSINYVGGSSGNSGSGKVSGEYMWPLENYKVTSEFNEDRGDGNHKGMDLDADMGTPIYASNGGVVEYVFRGCTENYEKGDTDEDCPDRCGNYGNYIRINHGVQNGNEIKTLYAHCTSVEESLKEGDTVSKGQLIGTVGTTGQSTGSHLHFEFIVNGEYVDPHDYIKEDGKASGVNASSKSKIRGEIATEYDENATLEDIVEGTKPYKFSNTSWINFVYKYALSMDGNIIVGTNVNSNYFDDSKKIMEEKIEKYEDTDVIDIANKISLDTENTENTADTADTPDTPDISNTSKIAYVTSKRFTSFR